MQHLITFATILGVTLGAVALIAGWVAAVGYAAFADDGSPRLQQHWARVMYGRHWNDDSTRAMVLGATRAAVIFATLTAAAATAVTVLAG